MPSSPARFVGEENDVFVWVAQEKGHADLSLSRFCAFTKGKHW